MVFFWYVLPIFFVAGVERTLVLCGIRTCLYDSAMPRKQRGNIIFPCHTNGWQPI